MLFLSDSQIYFCAGSVMCRWIWMESETLHRTAVEVVRDAPIIFQALKILRSTYARFSEASWWLTMGSMRSYSSIG